MPIFDNKGRKQNVQDAHAGKYAELYPDAITIVERGGRQYRVKAKDYNTFLGDTSIGTAATPAAPTAPVDKSGYTFTEEELARLGQSESGPQGDAKSETPYDANGWLQSDSYVPKPEESPYPTNPVAFQRVVDRENAEYERRAKALEGQLASTENSVAELLRERDAQVDQANRQKDVETPWYAKLGQAKGRGLPTEALTANGRFTDPEWRMLNAASRIVGESKELVDAAKNHRGMWRGIGRSLTDIDTWTSLMEGLDAKAIEEVANVDPEKATPAQQALLDAIAMRAAVEQQFGGVVSNWYKAGETIGNMVPLGIEMVVNPAGGFGRKAAQAALRKFAIEGTEGVAKKALKKAAVEGSKYVGSMVGGATMAGTTSLPGVAVRAKMNSIGQAQYDTDQQGNVSFAGFKEGDSYGKEFLKEYGRTAINHATEQMGAEWLSKLVGKPIGWLSKGVKKIPGAGKVANLLDNRVGAYLKNLAKDVNYNGPVEEFGEEFVAALHTAAIDGMDSLEKWFEGDNLATTGIAVTLPALLGLGVSAGYGTFTGGYKAGAKENGARMRAYERAANVFSSNPNEWNEITLQLNEPSTALQEMRRIYEDETYTNEQKAAALEYAVRAMRWMAASYKAKGIASNENMDMVNGMLNDIYSQGYNAAEDEMAGIKREYDMERERALTTLGEDIVQQLDDDPVLALSLMDEARREEAMSFVNARVRYEAVIDRISDDIDERIKASDKEIDLRANKGDGMIHPAMLRGENGSPARKVYVVNGRVALFEDGTIDKANSSDFIIVRDAETGELGTPLVSDFESADAAIDTETEKKTVADAIAEEYARQQAAIIEGGETAQTGLAMRSDAFSFTDEQGEHHIEVLSENKDEGMAKVIFDGVEGAMPIRLLNNLRRSAGVAQDENSTSTQQTAASETQPAETSDSAEETATGDKVSPVEPVIDKKARRAELGAMIPVEGKKKQYTKVEPAVTAEYISLLTDDVAKQMATADKYIANIQAAQQKADPIEALEMDEQIAYWNAVKALLVPEETAAENAQPVAETEQGVVSVETAPQATNEMQETELTEDVKTEDVNNQPEDNLEMVSIESGNDVLVDNQGNPVDADGKLIVEEVASIDEITNDDFENPTRNVKLPAIPENVANAIGTEGRPVVIKKNVFTKNSETHVELEPEDSRNILSSALYNPNLIGSTQPIKRPDYKIAIRTGEKNAVVVLDVYREKDYVEIVGWRLVNEKGLAKMQRQAEREGGQFLILSPNDGSAAALSALPFGSSSASEGTTQTADKQENSVKSEETEQKQNSKPINIIEKVEEMRRVPLRDRANMWMQRTGTPVRLVESLDEVINSVARAALEAGQTLTGWVDNNEVVLYLPNIASIDEIDKTYIHEVVAHMGLKALMNDKFDALCDKVWESMSEEARAKYYNYGSVRNIADETARKRAAADEYMAFLAEGVDLSEADKTVWDKVIEFFRQFVDSFGTKLSDKDIEELIKASYVNLKRGGEQSEHKADNAIEPSAQQTTNQKSAETIEKIEDVGEKIGGAKKDRFAEGLAKIKADIEESDETLMDRLSKLPVSQVFNFDLEKLREGGMPNEVVSFIKIVKNSIPAKPRKTYKIRSWVSNTLALYRLCLTAGTNWERISTLLDSPQFASSNVKEMFDAYMAIGGFDSGMNIGNAKLKQLNNKAGRYDENGKFISLEGSWYVRDAGKHGGIYNTKDEAINALKAFAGDNAGTTSNGKQKEVKFAVYQRRQDKSVFIAIKGKSDIIIQDGFTSAKEAFDYIEANNAELQERYRALLDKSNADFKDNRKREGRDYRNGKDIPAEEFRETFGFRGVEFGNWMTQEDRKKALNECYDALMDLAAVCKVSPQALSLGGTLGMAFGARGGGKFSAHYEPGKVVINMTKTNGAGALAHEWFHALDNYFAKMGSEGVDIYATGGEGLFPQDIRKIGKNYFDRKSGQMLTEEEYNEKMNSHEVRKEMAEAWKSLMETVNKSDYFKRSEAYARLHNSKYWARPTELGARAFSIWVENELSKQGMSNDYLANNPRFLVSEATDAQIRFMPYPFDADATWMEEAFGNLFEVMEEKTTDDGKVVLYRIADEGNTMEEINERFNAELEMLNDDNADSIILNIGNPSPILIAAGVEDKPMKLYGNKVVKKMKKHGFDKEDLIDLPIAVAEPIAVFNNHQKEGNRSILTELRTEQGNILVAIDLGRGIDIDFNIVSSAFGKGFNNVVGWINNGYATYINKEKALGYLHLSAPIAEASDKQKLSDATKVVESFENPIFESENLSGDPRFRIAKSRGVTANETYRRLAGEVESRNAQERMGMSPEERRSKLAEETEDVRREDQIFLEENLGVSDSAEYDDVPRLNRFRVENIFGGIWIEDAEEFAKFASAVRNYAFEEDGEGIVYTDNYFYAYYLNIDGKAIPYASVYLNSLESQEVVNRYNQEIKENGKQRGVREFIDRAYELSRNIQSKRDAEFGTDKGASNPRRNDSLDSDISRKGRYYDRPELFVKTKRADRFGIVDRQGNGPLTDRDVVMESDPYSKVLGKPRYYGKRQREFVARQRRRMADKAREIAEKLNLDNVEVLESTDGLTGKKATSKGWFDPRTGKITVVVPNHGSTGDIVETVLHEAVVHYGLRRLFGNNFENFLDNVYRNVTPEIRAEIAELAKKHGWDFHTATEEYLAGLAENTNFENVNPSLWGKIKGAFMRMLAKVGIILNEPLSDNELRYILWRSYRNMTADGNLNNVFGMAEDIAKQYELGVGNYAATVPEDTEAAEDESALLHRAGGVPGSAMEEYNRKVRRYVDGGNVKITDNVAGTLAESYLDSMRSLEVLQDAIVAETGNEIADNENAYMAENRMSSMNQAQTETYIRDYFTPMMEEVHKLVEDGEEYEDIVRYLHAKHGIERNEYMRRKQAEEAARRDMGEEPVLPNENEPDYEAKVIEKATWREELEELTESYVKKYAKRDYSGLTALTGTANAIAAEKAAQQMVNVFEREHQTGRLWRRINEATKETLKRNFVCGLIDRATYDTVSRMFNFYIPLRGWNSGVAAHEYEYLTTRQPLASPTMKTMHGRASLSDDPLATIGHMAESAIAKGNRNIMKQHFLRFVMNNPTSLATVSEQWYTYVPAENKWVPAHPTIPKDATPEQIAQIVEDFEDRMRAAERSGTATRKRSGLNIGFHATKPEEQEHIVKVMHNGKEYCVYINGSPRAAQALNGLTNPDVSDSRARKYAQEVKNFMARMFTTNNPAFIVTNLTRDVIWAGTAVMVKEDKEYVKQYTKNISGILMTFKLPSLIHKFQTGTLDMTNEVERYFNEFMLNGGETGFTQANTVEDYKKKIKRFIEESKGDVGITKKAWNGFWDGISFLNRSAEDITRFAVFMTSRQMGRSIAKSVWDAKEITVNFNKKGSGGWGQRYLNFLYIFFNATMQGLKNMGKLMVKHPGKMATALGAYGALGFMMPLINGAMLAMFGDDEDKDAYWNLPDWVRRNNIVIYVPWTDEMFITIPLPHELRPFYGMGEAAFAALSGRQETVEALADAALGLTEMLLPIDLTANGKNFWVNMTPTIGQPIAQVLANVDYFGKPIYRENDFNELNPDWTKAYKGTSKLLVGATKGLNEITGGNNVDSGWLDLNPAVIEHYLGGYFGGTGKTATKFLKTLAMIYDDDLRDVENVPVFSSLFQSTGERTEDRYLNERYFEETEALKEFQHSLNGYRKEIQKGNTEYEQLFEKLVNSDDFDYYQTVKGYSDVISELYSLLNNYGHSEEDKKEINDDIRSLKREMIEELEKLSSKDEPQPEE